MTDDRSHDAHESFSEKHGDHDGHGSSGVGKFLMVFAALCVLTVISFVAGSSSGIMATPQVGWTIMMAVSCAKALLVMMFFMHLLWEANWKYVLTIPASILALFLLLMLSPDIGFRTRHYSEERWLHAAEPRDELSDQHDSGKSVPRPPENRQPPSRGGHQ